MEAYLSGLEDRVNSGKPIDHINSVASFFVSRIDSKVDKYLESIINKPGTGAGSARALIGKIAIANARLAYQEFRIVFESERFTRLQSMGANIQRPLWASTSTKNPSFPDTLYVDELIGAILSTRSPQPWLPQGSLGLFRRQLKRTLKLRGKISESSKPSEFRC
jgi:transaldolase